MMADNAGSSAMIERDPPKKVEKRKTDYDVIIIGAGPAGYTAGIYTSRARRDTLIISGVLPGGQLMNTTEVENFPGFDSGIMGPDLMQIMRKQVERMGATIIQDEVANIDFRHKPFKVLTASEEYEGKVIIICTGANPKKIGLDGEKTFAGKGVSSCATCDGAFFKNQDLVVVGGGDSAMEESTFLTKYASSIHLVHRRDEFRASKIMQERALSNEKIKVHFNSVVEEIQGEQKVEKVILNNTKTGDKTTLEVGGVFIAIGHDPNTTLFKNQVDLDENGYVTLHKNTQTSIPGVFCAGDVHDHRYRQAVTAAGFGCMAAIDADKYLSEHE